jgi:hypothetical protein
MAIRPVFVPSEKGARLVEERDFEFDWSPGFAPVQKKKNIAALHIAAANRGLKRVLEISSKSDDELGRRLSAFSLKIPIDGNKYPLESVYQGSKVFKHGGPHTEIYTMSPRDSKKFIQGLDLGDIKGFSYKNQMYPLNPKNAFYDWLYIKSLIDHKDWVEKNANYDGFTDIEFNPKKQVNCQARAFAEFIGLLKRGDSERASSDFHYFASLLHPI